MKKFYIPYYKDFFAGEEPELSKLFKNCPTDIFLIFLFDRLNLLLFESEGNQELQQREIVETLSKNFSTDSKKIINSKFNWHSKRGLYSRFCSVKSILDLSIYLIQNCCNSNVNDSNPQYELNLFKAILIFNRLGIASTLNPSLIAFRNNRIETILRIKFSTHFSQLNHHSWNEHYFLLIKSILIIKEVENDERFKESFHDFLDFYNISTSNRLIGQFFLIVKYWIQNRGKSTINENDSLFNDFLKDKIFSLSDRSDFSSTQFENYKLFVEKPFYKSLDGNIYLTNYKFLLNKLYKGLIFDLFQILKSKIQLEFPKFDNFFSYISQTIIENKLFRGIMSVILNSKYYCANFEFSHTSDFNPDCYFEKDKYHFVFEFKNSLLSSKITNRDNFEDVFLEIEKKYASKKSKNNKKNKGIYQLSRNINLLIQEVEFKLKKGVQYIYPILVVNDELMSVPGVRYFLNDKLREEYNDMGNSSSVIFRDLTIIKLSTLFNLSITKSSFNFKDLIDEYLRKVRERSKNVNKSDDLKKSLLFYDDFESIVSFERISLVVNNEKFERLNDFLEIKDFLKSTD